MTEKDKKNRYKNGRFKDNNTAREKWTEEVVKRRLKKMLKRLKADEDNEICALIILAEKEGLYLDWFNHMRTKFKDNSVIIELMDQVVTQTESKLFGRALRREVDSYVALFGLKAYYKRVDRQHILTENDNKNDGKLDINFNYPQKNDE